MESNGTNGNGENMVERRAVRSFDWDKWISIAALLLPMLVGLLSLYFTFNNQLIKINIENESIQKDIDNIILWQKTVENKMATHDNASSIIKMTVARNTSECERNEKITQNLINKVEILGTMLTQHNEQFLALKERIRKYKDPD